MTVQNHGFSYIINLNNYLDGDTSNIYNLVVK